LKIEDYRHCGQRPKFSILNPQFSILNFGFPSRSGLMDLEEGISSREDKQLTMMTSQKVINAFRAGRPDQGLGL